MPQEVTLETPQGLTLAARVHGDPAGIPVLALHGWLDNAASFDRLAPLLTWARVVALDLPGHGLSAHRSADAGYPLIDYVTDVLAAADALGWSRFVLLGHSLGGAVACLAAGAAPQRVRALLLVDALGALTEAPELAPERLANHLEARRRLATKKAPCYRTIDDAVAARIRAGRFDSRLGVHTMVERGLVRETRDGEDVFAWRADARLTLPSAYRMTVGQVVAFMKRISCPTLLVRPDGGLPFDAESMALYRKAAQNLVVHDTVGGHHVHLDRPEVVAAFFEDVPQIVG